MVRGITLIDAVCNLHNLLFVNFFSPFHIQRGKFRPKLTEMVETNKPQSVLDASQSAFDLLPDVEQAMKALTVLKAVGPATASGKFCFHACLYILMFCYFAMIVSNQLHRFCNDGSVAVTFLRPSIIITIIL